MKKLKIVLTVLSIACSTSLFAQMDNLVNMSAEWMRTGARNASTDATDMVVYNPAGLTHMTDGFHINMSNQSMFRHPSHSYDLGMGEGMQTYTQGSSDMFLPNLYVAYKKNNWALYSGMFVVGGGATMDYPHGSITTDLVGMGALASAGGAYGMVKDQTLKASSMYMTTTIGGSYAINKLFSMSMSVRYIHAKNTADMGMTMTSSPIEMPDMPLALSTEDNANGFGGVISMNMTSIEHLSLSMRYETQVNLDFKTTQTKDDFGLTVNGATNRRDLPAVFAFGASYELSSKCKMYGDFNYYFQKNANWGYSSMATNGVPMSQLAGDATTYGMGFEYQVSSKVTASLGGGMTMLSFGDKAGYYTNLGTFEIVQSNNTNVNMGFAIKATDKIKINAGYMHVFYPSDQTIKALNAQPLDVDVTVNNSINAFAVGVDLAF